jgi:hypothetical protein
MQKIRKILPPNLAFYIISVDETTAMIEQEIAEEGMKTKEPLPKSDESLILESFSQASSPVYNQVLGDFSEDQAFDSNGQPLNI